MSSSSRDHASPFPAPTSPPVPARSLKRRLQQAPAPEPPVHVTHARSHHVVRQDLTSDVPSSDGVEVADQQQVAAAKEQCEVLSGNDVLSCWPISNTTVPQHQWATFVWNSRLPQYAQTNLVNIFLIHGDSQQTVLNATNYPNPTNRAGFIASEVNDTWWGDRGNMFDGTPIPFLFYWVITPADQSLESGLPQATFTALQTTFADSIIASMTSAAAASSQSAASASAASLSAASVASASAASVSASAAAASRSGSGVPTLTSAVPGASGTMVGGTGSVQSGGSGSSFPHWAIAVIVVLGFFALVASGILAFFISRRLRNRRQSTLSHRGSMGSSTPMMSAVQQGHTPQSPLLGGAVLGGAAAGAHRPASADAHDGASTVSGSEAAPFSGADAAIMADAFRAALRKPDFASRPVEEGESPEDINSERSRGPDQLLNLELAEEGRDIRSVSSSRGVRVETLSDAEDDDNATAQDYPH